MSSSVIRYSDEELAEFKAILEKRMVKTKESLDGLQSKILEITENTSDEHGVDWVDDSSIRSEVEMLNNMAIRQRRYLNDLENALIRIRSKSYGICVLTGELIDKKRLLAVPTTTKSLSAKTKSQNKNAERFRHRPKPSKQKAENKIISKIIRKPTANAPKNELPEEEELELLLNEEIIKPSKEDLEDLGSEQETDLNADRND